MSKFVYILPGVKSKLRNDADHLGAKFTSVSWPMFEYDSTINGNIDRMKTCKQVVKARTGMFVFEVCEGYTIMFDDGHLGDDVLLHCHRLNDEFAQEVFDAVSCYNPGGELLMCFDDA